MPFPVVAYACEPLIMQLVTAVERQLEVLVGEHLVGADARSSEEPGRMRKCFDHRMADRTSGDGSCGLPSKTSRYTDCSCGGAGMARTGAGDVHRVFCTASMRLELPCVATLTSTAHLCSRS